MKNKSRRNFLKVAGTSAALIPLMGNKLVSATAPAPVIPQPNTRNTCDYRLLRHAAAVLNYNNKKIMIDPMLNQAITNVPLPVNSTELTDILNDLDAILLTHLHTDHFNIDSWHLNLIKDKPFFCQSAQEGNFLTASGLNDVRVIGNQATFDDITIFKTGGQHGVGTGWIVSGFVFTAAGNKTVYVAGDTTYAPPVQAALQTYQPDITIVNSGAVGPTNNPWTMTAAHVGQVAAELPSTQIIAVHMEVHPNAQVTRSQLRQYTDDNNITEQVLIPDDGESINLCDITSVNSLSANNDSIKVFPNPFTDNVQFDIPGSLLHIRVMDINGKLVNTLYKPAWDGKDAKGTPVRGGLYILLISTNESFYTLQIMKE